MYVCVYVYICVYTYVYIYVCVHIQRDYVTASRRSTCSGKAAMEVAVAAADWNDENDKHHPKKWLDGPACWDICGATWRRKWALVLEESEASTRARSGFPVRGPELYTLSRTS